MEYLEERKPARIDEAAWRELSRRLAPVSQSYLRQLLAETGVPVDAPWGGVRQHTFEELAQSLIEMEQAYREAREAGDATRAALCRKLVIDAKDRAKRVARHLGTGEERKRRKAEMASWLLVWLENPEVFPVWVKLRKARPLPP